MASRSLEDAESSLSDAVDSMDAKIDTDTDGKMTTEYKPEKTIFWDCSQANIISQPKNESEIQKQVESCLKLVEYIKRDKPPAGVLLESTKISLSGEEKLYRLGHEFYKTGKVLGSGNTGGEMIVLKDTKTGIEHAQKTIMISRFRSNEIKCWVDLNDTGHVPRLYMFRIDGNQISVHMEIKENAKIDTDTDGWMTTEYKPEKKIFGQANIISQPIYEREIQEHVASCLKLVEYIKSDKPPAGVLLDSTKISLSGEEKLYRLGHEFDKTEVLGIGNTHGEIIVLKDTETGKEHAQKTIMISCFRSNEIKCWVDLNDTGIVPRLYMFRIDGNQISVHMEKLENAKTLLSIIIDDKAVFYKSDKSLVRPFSLFVLDRTLEAVSEMHEKGWVHKDLHADNVMVQKVSQKNLAVKILDFGLAEMFDYRKNGLHDIGFKSDISNVLRFFSILYTGEDILNDDVIPYNWKDLIHDHYKDGVRNGEKEELSCLVETAMSLVHPDDVSKFRQQVKDKLNEAMKKEEDKVMEKIVQLLFPEELQPIQHSSTAERGPDLPDL